MGTGDINYNSNLPGNSVFVTKSLAATSVTTTGVDITAASSGSLQIKFAQVRTDGVALAPATSNSVNLTTDQTVGDADVLTSTVGGLGSFSSATTTTPFVVDSGKKVSLKATNSALTSTGDITVDIVFERLTNGANILVAS